MNPSLDSPEKIAKDKTEFYSARILRQRSEWFVQLRWLAISFAFILFFIGIEWFNLSIQYKHFIPPLIFLLIFNVVLFIKNNSKIKRTKEVESNIIKLQMVVDLIALTVLMHFAGGAENPIFFIYFIHVYIAGLIFPGKEVFKIAGLAILLFSLEVICELFYLTTHYHIFSESTHMHDPLFLLMMLLMFWMVITFSAYMAFSMMQRYRWVRDKLYKKQRELIKTDKAKMDFFRFIAHEMKSPISTVQSALETIKSISNNSLDLRINKLINSSIVKTKQVLDTVKDIVDMTQGRERAIVDKSLINIKKLLDFAIHLVENENTSKSLNIHLDCSENLELITQPELLEKILSNLISNAVRYSGDNPKIDIIVIDENDVILIKVKDYGIGINQNDIDNIFKEFFRTSEAKEKERIGTGLGLSIVKRFTDLLDGKVSVESEISKGTTFILEFNKYV